MLKTFLNHPLIFLFISARGNAFISTAEATNNDWSMQKNTIDNAKQAKNIYDRQIRRYLGLGFLLSFIPGTEAFIARKEYLSSLVHLQNEFNRSQITNLSTTPFFFLNNFFQKLQKFADTNPFANHTIHHGFLDFLNYLPLVSDICSSSFSRVKIRKNWYKHLGHTLLNPIRVISSSLLFLRHAIFTLIDLGATTHYGTNLPRTIFKLFFAIIFNPFQYSIALIEYTVDLALGILDTLLLDPLRFGYEVVKQFFETRSDEFLYVPREEGEGVANIIRALGSNVGDSVGLDDVAKSKKYILKIFSHEQKEKYLEDYRFYNQIKTQECFLYSRNFAHMSTSNKQKLRLLYNWEKVRLFGIFAQAQNIPGDILKVVCRKLVDLNTNTEDEIKETSIERQLT